MLHNSKFYVKSLQQNKIKSTDIKSLFKKKKINEDNEDNLNIANAEVDGINIGRTEVVNNNEDPEETVNNADISNANKK